MNKQRSVIYYIKLILKLYALVVLFSILYYLFAPKYNIKKYDLLVDATYDFIDDELYVYLTCRSTNEIDLSNISVSVNDKIQNIEVLNAGEAIELEFKPNIDNILDFKEYGYDKSVIGKISGTVEINRDESLINIPYQVSYTTIYHRDYVSKTAGFLPDCVLSFDYKKDTDGDGLTDWQETCVLNTSPLLVDTSADGICDADEDIDGDGLSNLIELQYGLRPLTYDTKEVIADIGNEDLIKLHTINAEKEELLKGIDVTDDTVIGKLTIAASHSGGVIALTGGHTWLVFTANEDIDVDVSNMYAGYMYQPDIFSFKAQKDIDVIHLKAGDSITIGAFGFGRASSLVGNKLGELGGICYNTELQMLDRLNRLNIVGYSRDITRGQLNELVRYTIENNYYNFYTHNCVTTAVGAWNKVYGEEEFSGQMEGPLNKYYFPYILKKEILQKEGAVKDYSVVMYEILDKMIIGSLSK